MVTNRENPGFDKSRYFGEEFEIQNDKFCLSNSRKTGRKIETCNVSSLRAPGIPKLGTCNVSRFGFPGNFKG